MRNISESSVSLENFLQFFFDCRIHFPRIELLNKVSQYQIPSLSLRLYCIDSFSLKTNTFIFETLVIHVTYLVTRNVFREKLMSPTYPFPSLLFCFQCIPTHLFDCSNLFSVDIVGGRVVRWSWVNFQFWGVLHF